MGLIIAYVIYGILPLGSYLTIYGFAAVYLLAVLGLGLLISTFVSTQQQAMLISFFDNQGSKNTYNFLGEYLPLMV